jgi:hypothetical protein
VSSSSDHQPPHEPERRGPSTQEIPVVVPGPAPQQPAPLPPHPGAAAAPAATAEPQPTGPVDFVPGLPGAPAVQSPPPPAELHTPPGRVWPDTLESDLLESGERPRTAKVRRVAAPRDRAALLGLGLALLALVLLELGLAMDFRTRSYWSALPLWSAFATLCAGLGVVAFAASFAAGSRFRSGTAWRIAAGGLVGLAVFWVLVVLSVVASDRGFLLTAALGALGAALWVGPGRKA